jgi:hypothetical protein
LDPFFDASSDWRVALSSGTLLFSLPFLVLGAGVWIGGALPAEGSDGVISDVCNLAIADDAGDGSAFASSHLSFLPLASVRKVGGLQIDGFGGAPLTFNMIRLGSNSASFI